MKKTAVRAAGPVDPNPAYTKEHISAAFPEKIRKEGGKEGRDGRMEGVRE